LLFYWPKRKFEIGITLELEKLVFFYFVVII